VNARRVAVRSTAWLDRGRGNSKRAICFCQCFQCDVKLFLCLVTPSAETRERVLGNLVKLGAPLRVLTPKLLIDTERRNQKNSRIVISMSERMERKPLESERQNELQPNALPKGEPEIFGAELAKRRAGERPSSLANRRIAFAERSERVQLCKRFVGDTGREHAV
jgi:hypothetical protein